MEQLERHACVLASERYSFDTGVWVLGLIAPLGNADYGKTIVGCGGG